MEDKSKDYELIVVKANPLYKEIVLATEIVRKFIKDKSLIVYGGTAIDMALRLKGDHIYPDDSIEIPDYDFYSPDNVEHAYSLADILYNYGFTNVRAINAAHIGTLRVDIGNGNYVADISYMPKNLFDRIPCLVYNEIRIVSPLYQRIDTHSSLSFPYNNPPRENILHRFKKDITRFNKMSKYYDFTYPDVPNIGEIECNINKFKYVLYGFPAYAIIYKYYKYIIELCNYTEPTTRIPLDVNISVNGQIVKFTSSLDRVEFLSSDPVKILKKTNTRTYKQYNKLHNIALSRYETDDYIMYDTSHTLITYNSIQSSLLFKDTSNLSEYVRVSNVQPLLVYYLGKYITEPDRDTYLAFYMSLIYMIQNLDDIYVQTHKQIIESSPLFPTINVYGFDNTSASNTILINRIYAEMKLEKQYNTPHNYYPERTKERTGSLKHPIFNYKDLPLLHIDGSFIGDFVI